MERWSYGIRKSSGCEAPFPSCSYVTTGRIEVERVKEIRTVRFELDDAEVERRESSTPLPV